jgi:hypothetical protein
VLVAAAGALAFAASCKSNDITQNNNDNYESHVSQVVGPSGGFVELDPDKARVDIPASALSANTTITVGKVRGGYPAFQNGWQPIGGVYSFEPHGQTFAAPVVITVPYADPGKPVRLAVAEQGGGWSLVDAADLDGAFAHTQTSTFSYYAVITGAPAAPSDGGSDAAKDSGTDAGPPPTTLFVCNGDTLSGFGDGKIYRFTLAADGTPTPNGAFDGCTGAMAFGPNRELFVAGRNGGVARYGDAWASAPASSGSFATSLTSVAGLFFANGELWVSDTTTGTVSTFNPASTSAPTWTSAQLASSIGPIAWDDGSKSLFVVQGNPYLIARYTVSGSGANKTLTPAATVSDAGRFDQMFVAPWSELFAALSANGSVERFVLDAGAPTPNGNVQGGVVFPVSVAYAPAIGQLYVGQLNGIVYRVPLSGMGAASAADAASFNSSPQDGGYMGVTGFLIGP